MKYEIRIEGGFTGIPKEYHGEIELQENEKQGLWHVFQQDKAPENPKLRDGLTYHLKLIENDKEREALFDETNLPLPIRRFIDTVSKKK